MAELSRAALLQKIIDFIIDNNIKAITPAQLREILTDFGDSVPFRLSDAGLGFHKTTVNYQEGQAVIVGGDIFTSNINNNIGVFDLDNWTKISGGADVSNLDLDLYDNGTTYAIDEFVEFELKAFISLQNANQGNTPTTSPAFWEQLTANSGNFGNIYQNGLFAEFDVVRFDNRLWELTVDTSANPFNSTDIEAEIANGDWRQVMDEAGDAESFQDSVIKIHADPSTLVLVKEDRFLIDNGAVGIWSGRDGQIADFRGTNFRYIIPEDGFLLKVNTDDNVLYQHEGDHVIGTFAWISFPAGGATAAGNPGEIQFNTGGLLDADPNAFWDNVNKRIGIRVIPTATAHFKGVGSTSATFAQKIDNSADSPLLYVQDDGKIGMGTNNPLNPLEVIGTDPGDGNIIAVKRPTNIIGSGCGIIFNLNNAANNTAIYGLIAARLDDNTTGSQDGSVIMEAVKDNALVRFLTGNSNRDVRIGASGPISARLHVVGKGNTSSTTALRIEDNVGGLLFRLRDDGRADIVGDTIVGGNLGVNLVTALAKIHAVQSSITGAIPVLILDQADLSEEMIEFKTTIGIGNPIETIGAKTLTTTHFIKITLPGGLTRYIPAGTIA